MKRILFVFPIAVALACGSVNDKQGCSVSTECPVGQYCATAGGESKCWPDPVLPTASAVSASCTPGPCLRDSVLHVQATVTDDKEVLDASVSLDLDSARSFPMAKSGPSWVADVPLRALPFDAFSQNVVPTVVARDGARNSSAPASGAGVAVTRLKWTYNAAAPLTSPAVMSDGTAVVGVSAAADQVLAISAGGTKAWSRTLGTAAAVVTAAPAVGQFAIWVGSEDGKVYAVALDGSAANSGVDLTAAVKGSVAVLGAGAKEWCFATVTSVSGTGFIGTASSQGESAISSAPAQEAFTTGPIVATDDRIHAPTANSTNSATLRTFELSTAPVSLSGTWTASIGKKFGATIAMDGSGGVISADDLNLVLNRTAPGLTPVVTKVGDLSGVAMDSAVVTSGGDVIVGDQSGRLHRFGATGPVWSSPPVLGSPVFAPLVLSGTTAPFIVPTNAGNVYALADDGTTKWQTTLPSATQLRAGNIFTPPSQPPGPTMSVAYFSSGNGHLYAVIVDGQLDGSAPWPKAFHDPRNTNHAGPQP